MHDYFQEVRAHDRSATRWNWLPDSIVGFWYRQSPRFLERESFLSAPMIFEVTHSDPHLFYSGEALVYLDRRGRLLELEVLPPQLDESPGTTQAPDWSVLFREAGLDPAKWIAVEPNWTPNLYADMRMAWQGTRAPPRHPRILRFRFYRSRFTPIETHFEERTDQSAAR